MKHELPQIKLEDDGGVRRENGQLFGRSNPQPEEARSPQETSSADALSARGFTCICDLFDHLDDMSAITPHLPHILERHLDTFVPLTSAGLGICAQPNRPHLTRYGRDRCVSHRQPSSGRGVALV